MVMDIARRKIRTNLSLEDVGGIQKPVTNAREDAINARNKVKVPFKDVYEEKKPDEKRSLWHGLFKDIAPNLLQLGCLITLILCVFGTIVSPFMPFIIYGCVIGACFPNYVVDALEKVVTFIPKTLKKAWIETKFFYSCWKYDRDCKDFWGSRTTDPRTVRRHRKAAKKAYMELYAELNGIENVTDDKSAEAIQMTFDDSINSPAGIGAEYAETELFIVQSYNEENVEENEELYDEAPQFIQETIFIPENSQANEYANDEAPTEKADRPKIQEPDDETERNI